MIETLDLTRQTSTANGTFGQIFRNGSQICVTCEPAIPFAEGEYVCIKHDGPKFSNVWEITNIPGHTAILIHAGNTIEDTHGCVLVGDTYGQVNGLPAVINSVITLNKLRAQLPDTFNLNVTFRSIL